jgi:ribosomal protein S18 acetylase RimI-like enzyme
MPPPIRRFEELSNNAWPALQTVQYDGWLLRFGNGVTKRSNSVNMLYPSTLDPDEKIAFCEQLYLGNGIASCFKVTAISDPTGIDAHLHDRGYFIHSTVSFRTLNHWPAIERPERDFLLESEMRPEWIDEFIRMNRFEVARRPVYVEIMNNVLTPKCLVSLTDKGTTIGVGLGVLGEKHLGIFDLVVDPEWRKQGIGEGLVNALLQWGRSQGAETAYLQVLSDNTDAIRLYDRIGFREIYKYWYRVKQI